MDIFKLNDIIYLQKRLIFYFFCYFDIIYIQKYIHIYAYIYFYVYINTHTLCEVSCSFYIVAFFKQPLHQRIVFIYFFFTNNCVSEFGNTESDVSSSKLKIGWGGVKQIAVSSVIWLTKPNPIKQKKKD